MGNVARNVMFTCCQKRFLDLNILKGMNDCPVFCPLVSNNTVIQVAGACWVCDICPFVPSSWAQNPPVTSCAASFWFTLTSRCASFNYICCSFQTRSPCLKSAFLSCGEKNKITLWICPHKKKRENFVMDKDVFIGPLKAWETRSVNAEVAGSRPHHPNV